MSELVNKAKEFARKLHADQKRKGVAQEPYEEHLAEVVDFTARHGGDEIAVAAAWLHDTVEDCPATFDDLETRFGTEVTGLVRELTDDKSLDKAERKRLQIAHAPGKSERAALIKLGDKTSNVKGVAASKPAHWDDKRCVAYLDWAEDVVDNLPPTPPAALQEFRETLARSRQALAECAD